MGTGRADDPASQAWRPPARGECPRGSERRLLRAFDRLPVAGAAEGPAAQEHGALLLHAVGWMARWSASITRSMSRHASRKGARRARRPRSSTARAPRPLKRGLRARPERL